MSLEDQLEQEFAPAWRPEPGQQIIGEIVSITSNDNGWGAYPILTLKTKDGSEHAVHAFHSVLVDELKKVRPQVGHRIGIKYFGKPEGKNYERYKVASEDAPAFDWGAPPALDEYEIPVEDGPPQSDVPLDPGAFQSQGEDPDKADDPPPF